MKKLMIPFLLSLKKGTFKPTRVFTGVDELEDLTFELKSVNKTADEIMQEPEDTDKLKFMDVVNYHMCYNNFSNKLSY